MIVGAKNADAEAGRAQRGGKDLWRSRGGGSFSSFWQEPGGMQMSQTCLEPFPK